MNNEKLGEFDLKSLDFTVISCRFGNEASINFGHDLKKPNLFNKTSPRNSKCFISSHLSNATLMKVSRN